MKKKEVLGVGRIENNNFESMSRGLIYGSASSEKNADFRFTHCKRVSTLCLHLAEWEDISLEKCLVMGIIHDAYKFLARNTEHGILAANMLKAIVKEYFPKKKELELSKLKSFNEWKDVIEAIQFHSLKNPEGKLRKSLKNNRYYKVLCDADVLDHIDIEYVKFFAEGWREGKYDETALEMVKEVLPYKGKSSGFTKIKNEKMDGKNN